jgi:hypothetical protein
MLLFLFSPEQTPGREHAREVPLRIRRIDASCGTEASPLLTDRNIATAWGCGGSDAPRIVVELETDATVTSLTERAGRRPADPTARLRVETSVDGRSWNEAWEGSIAFPALAGSLSNPLQNPATVRFDGRRARFVRLRQTGTPANYRWWIAELEITGTR